MKTFLFLSFFMTATAGAACRDLVKLHGTLDLEKSAWSDTEIEPKKVKVCVPVDDAHANLLLTFKKDKKEFTAKIYSALAGFYDTETKDKKMTGGKYEIRQVFIDTWAPEWVKGSTLNITEIESKKKLAETKL